MRKTISVIICLCILLLSSCTGKLQKYTTTDFTVFDTEAVIVGYDINRHTFEKKSEAILELLGEYHKLYDIYNNYSKINNLKTVNDNAGKAPVKVDKKIIDLIEYGKEIYDLTKGKVNIALGSVLSIWHDYRQKAVELPPMDNLREAALHTDINNIVVDEENLTVYLSDPLMSIDVGAIAKGYAIDKCAELIASNGWDNMALNIGGNIHTAGLKGDGEKWITGINNPDHTSNKAYVCELELDRWTSLTTSGSYMRYYEVDGKRYHHIIDPEILMPKNTFVSVSVLSESSALGDALSTALFNMSEAEGRELLKSAGAEAMWVYADQSTSYTELFSENLKR